MSAENVEVVRRIHEAWNAGESPQALGLLAADIEWVNPPEAVETGIRQGADAFDAATRSVGESFSDVTLVIDEFIDAGDRVVALGAMHARGRASGIDSMRPQGYVWTLRDGQAVRFQWFSDHDRARAAAGLDSAQP